MNETVLESWPCAGVDIHHIAVARIVRITPFCLAQMPVPEYE